MRFSPTKHIRLSIQALEVTLAKILLSRSFKVTQGYTKRLGFSTISGFFRILQGNCTLIALLSMDVQVSALKKFKKNLKS